MTSASITYVITVVGHLDQHWFTWLDGVDIAHEPNGTTVLAVRTADQAQLHGTLAVLRDMGAEISALHSDRAAS